MEDMIFLYVTNVQLMWKESGVSIKEIYSEHSRNMVAFDGCVRSRSPELDILLIRYVQAAVIEVRDVKALRCWKFLT